MSSSGSTVTNSPTFAGVARQPDTSGFWVTHGLLPFLLVALLLLGIHVVDLDARLADHFYDANSARWIGANSWWAGTLVHEGGRWLLRLVALGALLAWLATFLPRVSSRYRYPAAYLMLSIILSTALVGALKAVTNVDCPWDLARYGGEMPLVPWFADRPDELPRAQCFPGAHSASGFSLLCLYFLAGHLRLRRRWAGLAIGLTVGGIFSFAQQARGAHFLSHDLASAIICWLVVLALYRVTGGRWAAATFPDRD